MSRRLLPVLVPALVAVLAAALLAGCDGDNGGDGRTFRNPVHAENFPDPFVLRADDTWHAYGTNDEDGNVQTMTSPDLLTWTQGPDALPQLGAWALEGNTWAPEVLELDGRYVLYYTAKSGDEGVQCVGRAVAESPQGPFRDTSGRPLVCDRAEGGDIDASPFRDEDGSLYLLWKNDGNAIGEDTWIYSQRLAAGGLRLTGERARLVKQDAPWEGPVVEAPTLWHEDGRYYLFFSGNIFDSGIYAVGYATCDGPLGPCRDAPENPVMKGACDATGPGHQTVVRNDDGDTWLVYHAYPASGEDEREVWLDPVVWEDGKPVVNGPTCRAQPAP